MDAISRSAWQLSEIRRRIARLFSAASIRSIDDSRFGVRAREHAVRPGEAGSPARCAGEGTLRLQAACMRAPGSCGPLAVAADVRVPDGATPSAAVRSLGDSLTRRPAVIAAAPMRSDLLRSFSAPILTESPHGVYALAVSRLPRASWRPVSFGPAAGGLAAVAALELEAVDAVVRVCPEERAARMAIERKRLPMPARGAMQEPFVYPAERSALAAANGLQTDEIRLVGVYLAVPLGAAAQMEFDESTGALWLTLRQDASDAIRRFRQPVVKLVLGKVKATGRVVRAIL